MAAFVESYNTQTPQCIAEIDRYLQKFGAEPFVIEASYDLGLPENVEASASFDRKGKEYVVHLTAYKTEETQDIDGIAVVGVALPKKVFGGISIVSSSGDIRADVITSDAVSDAWIVRFFINVVHFTSSYMKYHLVIKDAEAGRFLLNSESITQHPPVEFGQIELGGESWAQLTTPNRHSGSLQRSYERISELFSKSSKWRSRDVDGVKFATLALKDERLPLVKAEVEIMGWEVDDVASVISSFGARKICKFCAPDYT